MSTTNKNQTTMKLRVVFTSILIFGYLSLFSQTEKSVLTMSAVNDFSVSLRPGKAPNRLPYNPYHVEKEWDALAGDDLNFAFHMASAEGSFKGEKGTYTVVLYTLTERDGECAYNVYVNDKPVGLCQKNPPTNEFCSPAMLIWENVEIPEKALIRVESNSYSNLRRPEGSFFEYARGRWSGIAFIPERINKSPFLKASDPSFFGNCMKIGTAKSESLCKYDTPSSSYFLISEGSGTESNVDSFGYLFREAKGDFIIEAGVSLLGVNKSIKSNAGIMIRETTDPGSPFISCSLQPGGNIIIRYRKVSGKEVHSEILSVKDAEMLQLERKNEKYIMSAAKFGQVYSRDTLLLPGFNKTVNTGFFVFSGSEKEKEAASFSNIRFFNPIK